MTKDKARSVVMGAISMALKDPTLQQGFEIICKNLADLEKENAELKSENQKWKDEWQEKVQEATDEGYARTLQTMQLTKAKEYIKLLLMNCVGVYESTGKTIAEIQAEAEQFLNSEVEK